MGVTGFTGQRLKYACTGAVEAGRLQAMPVRKLRCLCAGNMSIVYAPTYAHVRITTILQLLHVLEARDRTTPHDQRARPFRRL